MNRSVIYPAFFICLLLAGKLSHAQKVGGSCGYKHTIYPAKVLKIHSYDTARMNIIFEVTYEKYKDTTSYYFQFHRYIRKSEADAKGVVVGAKFKYIESHIVSGACTPFIKRLTLDKYEE